MPVIVYSHSVGQSVTGGFVYRGDLVPDLYGKFVYADYVSGSIWQLVYHEDAEPDNKLLMQTGLNISSFGVDAENELYICAFDGKIYRFKYTAETGINSVTPHIFNLHNNYPNPFNSSTTISFELFKQGYVNLKIYNNSGQIVRTLFEGLHSAGLYRVDWEGVDEYGWPVGSGVYCYRLKTDTSIASGQMMLIK